MDKKVALHWTVIFITLFHHEMILLTLALQTLSVNQSSFYSRNAVIQL